MPSLVNLNTISPSLRDFLIGMSLHPITATVTNNNLTPLLGHAGGETGVGLPFTVNYISSVTPLPYSLQSLGNALRGPMYAINQYQGVVSATQNDYEDMGNVIGAPLTITNLPNSGGTSTYGLSILSSLPPNLYYSNTTPDEPYTSIAAGTSPYAYSVGKNPFFKSPKSNNYSQTYYQLSPNFPAIKPEYDDNGKPYGPNFNYNLYKGSKDEITYAGNSLYPSMGVANQKEGYLDANGKLNVGGPSTEPYNTITSLFHGGIGFNKNGGNLNIVNNNDIRNTIVGRALTATGLINDTNLGIIGAQRLAISLANNSAFKLEKETIGRVNLDIFSWIDGKKDNFIVPNYEITVPAGKFGKTLDFLGDLAGFTMPRSQMKTEFFSFDERFTPTLIGNIARANGMLETTGKGQVIALFRNMQANLYNSNFVKQGYAPGIVNKRVDGDDAIRFNLYAYDNPDGEILENTDLYKPDSFSYGNERWTSTDGSGFEADYFNFTTDGNGGNFGSPTESNFIWADNKFNNDKNVAKDLITQANSIFGDSPGSETNSLYQPNRKSILYKTKELFKNGYMSTLVNGHGIDTDNVTQIQSAVHKNKTTGKYVMSKGNAALTKLALNGDFSDYSKIFCRTWTPMDKYDEVNDLVRHSKLLVDGGTYKRRSPLSEYSVLENTGFVKIAHYLNDTGSIKRYMFSIENLAFRDIDNLPDCERGPYDGRIMWFPPYDIKFSESTSVNWDKYNFIGRGEPMYTYNNSERTGQLSFKVIIDHPNQLNRKEDNNIIKDDEHFYSFFAGCNPLDLLTPEQKNKNDKDTNPNPIIKVDEDVKAPSKFNVFFPNDNWEYPNINPEYESGLADASGVGSIRTIVSTLAEKKKWLYPVNYNNYMGYSDADKNKEDKTGKTKLGPVSPIGLSAADYNSRKINYTTYPAGQYLGLGMTVNSVKTVSEYTLKYTDTTNFGLNANRHDTGEQYKVIDKNNVTTNIGNLLEIPNVGTWSGWLAASGEDTNRNPLDISYLDALKTFMHYDTGPCKNCIIKIYGYASQQGSVDNTESKNQTLSNKRANNIRDYLLNKLIDPNDPLRKKRIVVTKGSGETNYFNEFATYKDSNGNGIKDECDEKNPNKSNVDALGCKLNRRVAVVFEHVSDLRNKPAEVKKDPVISEESKKIIKTLVDSMYSECDYFQKLAQNDPFTYSKITDKIKYFTPAFHSTTPEGFNARLTFLQQCTRQGPSVYTNTEKPDNLVFGRPPVCVLRIGDFYYTKIIIENISFDFEPLVWDLNPEGIGVQPMIANVSMNFAFIGGSSLDGPITKLQNGISRNYFANTPLYDSNADDNGAIKTAEINNLLAEKNVNELSPDKDQTKEDAPVIDAALTAKDIDKKILSKGVLSLNFDDSGIFQGKVKGKFTISSKLSKEYSIKLITNQTNPKLPNESIDVQTMKFNELKVNFASKTKTTNTLQKWDFYFTDGNGHFQNYYELAQGDLDRYVLKNTVNPDDMTGNEADKWEFIKRENETVLSDNYSFIIQIDELDLKKEFRARWVPKFKVKVNKAPTGTKPSYNVESASDTTYHITYEAYLSGGRLDILTDGKTPDETDDAIKQKTLEDKQAAKNSAKAKKELDKYNKSQKKINTDKQKAEVAKGKGSLL